MKQTITKKHCKTKRPRPTYVSSESTNKNSINNLLALRNYNLDKKKHKHSVEILIKDISNGMLLK